MKRNLITVATGVIAGIISAKAYIAHKRTEIEAETTDAVLDFIAEEEREEDDLKDEPLFFPGQNVIVRDPMIEGNEYQPPYRAQVTTVGRIESGVYVYQLDDQPEWINENWIIPDDPGPKIIEVITEEELTEEDEQDPIEQLREEIDDLLDLKNETSRLLDVYGTDDLIERLRRIQIELTGKSRKLRELQGGEEAQN